MSYPDIKELPLDVCKEIGKFAAYTDEYNWSSVKLIGKILLKRFFKTYKYVSLLDIVYGKEFIHYMFGIRGFCIGIEIQKNEPPFKILIFDADYHYLWIDSITSISNLEAKIGKKNIWKDTEFMIANKIRSISCPKIPKVFIGYQLIYLHLVILFGLMFGLCYISGIKLNFSSTLALVGSVMISTAGIVLYIKSSIFDSILEFVDYICLPFYKLKLQN